MTKQTQFDRCAMFGKQGKVHSRAVPRRTQWIRLAWPCFDRPSRELRGETLGWDALKNEEHAAKAVTKRTLILFAMFEAR